MGPKLKPSSAKPPTDETQSKPVTANPIVPDHNFSRFGNQRFKGRKNNFGRVNNAPRKGLGSRGK